MSDLGNRDAVEVVKDQHRDLLFGHPSQAAHGEALRLASLYQVLRQLLWVRGLREVIESLGAAASRPAAEVARDAIREPEEPRSKRTGGIVRIQLPVDVDEHFVRCILEICLRDRQAPKGPEGIGQFAPIDCVEIERHWECRGRGGFP